MRLPNVQSRPIWRQPEPQIVDFHIAAVDLAERDLDELTCRLVDAARRDALLSDEATDS